MVLATMPRLADLAANSGGRYRILVTERAQNANGYLLLSETGFTAPRFKILSEESHSEPRFNLLVERRAAARPRAQQTERPGLWTRMVRASADRASARADRAGSQAKQAAAQAKRTSAYAKHSAAKTAFHQAEKARKAAGAFTPGEQVGRAAKWAVKTPLKLAAKGAWAATKFAAGHRSKEWADKHQGVIDHHTAEINRKSQEVADHQAKASAATDPREKAFHQAEHARKTAEISGHHDARDKSQSKLATGGAGVSFNRGLIGAGKKVAASAAGQWVKRQAATAAKTAWQSGKSLAKDVGSAYFKDPARRARVWAKRKAGPAIAKAWGHLKGAGQQALQNIGGNLSNYIDKGRSFIKGAAQRAVQAGRGAVNTAQLLGKNVKRGFQLRGAKKAQVAARAARAQRQGTTPLDPKVHATVKTALDAAHMAAKQKHGGKATPDEMRTAVHAMVGRNHPGTNLHPKQVNDAIAKHTVGAPADWSAEPDFKPTATEPSKPSAETASKTPKSTADAGHGEPSITSGPKHGEPPVVTPPAAAEPPKSQSTLSLPPPAERPPTTGGVSEPTAAAEPKKPAGITRDQFTSPAFKDQRNKVSKLAKNIHMSNPGMGDDALKQTIKDRAKEDHGVDLGDDAVDVAHQGAKAHVAGLTPKGPKATGPGQGKLFKGLSDTPAAEAPTATQPGQASLFKGMGDEPPAQHPGQTDLFDQPAAEKPAVEHPGQGDLFRTPLNEPTTSTASTSAGEGLAAAEPAKSALSRTPLRIGAPDEPTVAPKAETPTAGETPAAPATSGAAAGAPAAAGGGEKPAAQPAAAGAEIPPPAASASAAGTAASSAAAGVETPVSPNAGTKKPAARKPRAAKVTGQPAGTGKPMAGSATPSAAEGPKSFTDLHPDVQDKISDLVHGGGNDVRPSDLMALHQKETGKPLSVGDARIMMGHVKEKVPPRPKTAPGAASSVPPVSSSAAASEAPQAGAKPPAAGGSGQTDPSTGGETRPKFVRRGKGQAAAPASSPKPVTTGEAPVAAPAAALKAKAAAGTASKAAAPAATATATGGGGGAPLGDPSLSTPRPTGGTCGPGKKPGGNRDACYPKDQTGHKPGPMGKNNKEGGGAAPAGGVKPKPPEPPKGGSSGGTRKGGKPKPSAPDQPGLFPGEPPAGGASASASPPPPPQAVTPPPPQAKAPEPPKPAPAPATAAPAPKPVPPPAGPGRGWDFRKGPPKTPEDWEAFNAGSDPKAPEPPKPAPAPAKPAATPPPPAKPAAAPRARDDLDHPVLRSGLHKMGRRVNSMFADKGGAEAGKKAFHALMKDTFPGVTEDRTSEIYDRANSRSKEHAEEDWNELPENHKRGLLKTGLDAVHDDEDVHDAIGLKGQQDPLHKEAYQNPNLMGHIERLARQEYANPTTPEAKQHKAARPAKAAKAAPGKMSPEEKRKGLAAALSHDDAKKVGLDPTKHTTADEVKKWWKTTGAQFHPDRHPNTPADPNANEKASALFKKASARKTELDKYLEQWLMRQRGYRLTEARHLRGRFRMLEC